MSEEETKGFCDRLIKQINIAIKNVQRFADFDLCGLRTAAKTLVNNIEGEEDKRDEKEKINQFITGLEVEFPGFVIERNKDKFRVEIRITKEENPIYWITEEIILQMDMNRYQDIIFQIKDKALAGF